MADNLNQKTPKVNDKSKHCNAVHRTTSETIRLGEPEKLIIHPTSLTPSTVNQKKKTPSFQITSVTVGSRMSNDGADDSADDLDESHTESDVIDSSRITDLENETPSYSEDTFSKDDIFFNPSTTSLGTAPVIPTSSQYGLAIVAEGSNLNIGANISGDVHVSVSDNVINIDTKTEERDHSHNRNERFKVVKIESTEPFRRGRWICMDYLDHTTVQSQTNVVKEDVSVVSASVPATAQYIQSDNVVGDNTMVHVDDQSGVDHTGAKAVSMQEHQAMVQAQVPHPVMGQSQPNFPTISPSQNQIPSQTVVPQPTQHQSLPQVQQAVQGMAQVPQQHIQQVQPKPQYYTQGQQPQHPGFQTHQDQGQIQQQLAQNTSAQQVPLSSQNIVTAVPSSLTSNQQPQAVPVTQNIQQQKTVQTQQQTVSAQTQTIPQQSLPQQQIAATIPQPQQPQIAGTMPQPQVPQAGTEYISIAMPQQPQAVSQSLPASQATVLPPHINQVNIQGGSLHPSSQTSVPQAVPVHNNASTLISNVNIQQQAQQGGYIPQAATMAQTVPSQNPTQVNQTPVLPQTLPAQVPSSGPPNFSHPVAQTTVTHPPRTDPSFVGQRTAQVPHQTIGIEQMNIEGQGDGHIASAALLESLVEVTAANEEAQQGGEDAESASGTSAVAIDNKIEQAMDLVKSHLMFAVREEVEVLKEKIAELMDRINQLEYENSILKAHASQETLAQLSQQPPKSQPPNSVS